MGSFLQQQQPCAIAAISGFYWTCLFFSEFVLLCRCISYYWQSSSSKQIKC